MFGRGLGCMASSLGCLLGGSLSVFELLFRLSIVKAMLDVQKERETPRFPSLPEGDPYYYPTRDDSAHLRQAATRGALFGLTMTTTMLLSFCGVCAAFVHDTTLGWWVLGGLGVTVVMLSVLNLRNGQR